MTCKRLSRKARAEQDYWLSFADCVATEEERMEFLRYDSHGGEKLSGNPILQGKSFHGMFGEVMRDGYFDMEGGWPGGMYVVADYLTREPFNIRPLCEWFGDKAVHRWLTAFFYEALRV